MPIPEDELYGRELDEGSEDEFAYRPSAGILNDDTISRTTSRTEPEPGPLLAGDEIQPYDFNRSTTSLRRHAEEDNLDDVPASVRRRLNDTRNDDILQVFDTEAASSSNTVSNALVQEWHRSGTGGAGVDLLERRTAFAAFMTERTTEAVQKKKFGKKPSPMGRDLDYATADETLRAGIREARRAEWEKWQSFQATVPLDAEAVARLRSEGHRVIPTRWVDTDKNFFKRREGGPFVPVQHKA